MWGGITCLIFMAITQLEVVKQMPYLLSNLMALMTCFPMAMGLLALGKVYSNVFENRMLSVVGAISYEVYLVHAFTLRVITPSIWSIMILAVITVIMAWLTFRCSSMVKRKNDLQLR